MYIKPIPSRASDITNYSCIQTPFEENAGIFCIWDIALVKYWFALISMAIVSLMIYTIDESAQEEHIGKHET